MGSGFPPPGQTLDLIHFFAVVAYRSMVVVVDWVAVTVAMDLVQAEDSCTGQVCSVYLPFLSVAVPKDVSVLGIAETADHTVAAPVAESEPDNWMAAPVADCFGRRDSVVELHCWAVPWDYAHTLVLKSVLDCMDWWRMTWIENSLQA